MPGNIIEHNTIRCWGHIKVYVHVVLYGPRHASEWGFPFFAYVVVP